MTTIAGPNPKTINRVAPQETKKTQEAAKTTAAKKAEDVKTDVATPQTQAKTRESAKAADKRAGEMVGKNPATQGQTAKKGIGRNETSATPTQTAALDKAIAGSGMKTNQDLINHGFDKSDKTFSGAQKFLKDNYGQDLGALTKNRSDALPAKAEPAAVNKAADATAAQKQNLNTAMKANDLKSNQDLINHGYEKSDKTFSGAEKFLKENYGQDLGALAKSRADALPTKTEPVAAKTAESAAKDTPTDAQVNNLTKSMKDNDLKTNQDLINHGYEKTDKTFSGAGKFLSSEYGQKIDQLADARKAPIAKTPEEAEKRAHMGLADIENQADAATNAANAKRDAAAAAETTKQKKLGEQFGDLENQADVANQSADAKRKAGIAADAVKQKKLGEQLGDIEAKFDAPNAKARTDAQGLLKELDNGGRWYNLGTSAGDGEVNDVEVKQNLSDFQQKYRGLSPAARNIVDDKLTPAARSLLNP